MKCDTEACHADATKLADTTPIGGQLALCDRHADADTIRHGYDGNAVPVGETVPL